MEDYGVFWLVTVLNHDGSVPTTPLSLVPPPPVVTPQPPAPTPVVTPQPPAPTPTPSSGFNPGVATLPPPVASPPGAPTAVTGAPGNQTVALSWTAPASNGGSAITGHRVTPYVGGSAQTPIATGSAATSYTVTGLTNGTAYTFRVAAINAVGTGPDSAASAPVTPTAPPPPPAATTVVSLTFDDGSWTQWSARQTLRDHNMRATFYVNSGLTTDQPGGWRMTWSQLRDLAADGHEITGHTLTHPDLTQLTPEGPRPSAWCMRTTARSSDRAL